MSILCLNMTINWEGKTLNNINELSQLRDSIDALLGFEIPYTHFLSPRHWLTNLSQTEALFNRVYRSGLDEVALHINCWPELLKVAGVPSIVDRSLNREQSGYATPLGLYNSKQINDIIAKSKEILTNIFPQQPISGFRCGCWLACDNVFTALMHNHFAYDSSAVPATIFSEGYSKNSFGNGKNLRGGKCPSGGYANYYRYLTNLWGYHEQFTPSECRNSLTKLWNPDAAITATSQPYNMYQGKYSLTQMPNNGALADYITSEYLINTLDQLLWQQASNHNRQQPLFFNIGCQQHSPHRAKMPLLSLFKHIKSQSMGPKQLRYLTVKQACDYAKQYLPD